MFKIQRLININNFLFINNLLFFT